MIYFSKEMNSLIKSKKVTKDDLTKYLLLNLSALEMVNELADYILKEDTAQQITVTQEEYDRITSLFKIRGQRCVEGQYIQETRGRKKATANKEEL